jgi:hypothetical protein
MRMLILGVLKQLELLAAGQGKQTAASLKTI